MNLMEIKETLDPQNIKQILSEFGIYPVREDTDYFVFPTVCHNIEGGSPKLYYYFNTKLFTCYTSCNDSFDIFELIRKMEKLHGYNITVFDAAEKIGFGNAVQRQKTEEDIMEEKNKRFIEHSLSRTLAPPLEYEALNVELLESLNYNPEYLKPWKREGISDELLKQFEIGYSVKDLAIAMPHRGPEGDLIGVRGRFMAKDAPNKYMPLSMNGRLLAHAIRGNLYGYYQNIDNIRAKSRAVLYEGEKSVLLHGSYYGQENNIALATCGNKVTTEQINLLIGNSIQEVVLAFDQDFQDPYERDALIAKYNEIGERMAEYFKVSILIDWEGDLDYKDSPIDKGPEVFNKLFKERYYVGGL